LRIRLLFRPRLQSMQLKMTNGFNLRNDHADACYSRKWSDFGFWSAFRKILTSGPEEKRRIQPELTPAFRIRGHLWLRWIARTGHAVRRHKACDLHTQDTCFARAGHVVRRHRWFARTWPVI